LLFNGYRLQTEFCPRVRQAHDTREGGVQESERGRGENQENLDRTAMRIDPGGMLSKVMSTLAISSGHAGGGDQESGERQRGSHERQSKPRGRGEDQELGGRQRGSHKRGKARASMVRPLGRDMMTRNTPSVLVLVCGCGGDGSFARSGKRSACAYASRSTARRCAAQKAPPLPSVPAVGAAAPPGPKH
jgi:hypothetical protein